MTPGTDFEEDARALRIHRLDFRRKIHGLADMLRQPEANGVGVTRIELAGGV